MYLRFSVSKYNPHTLKFIVFKNSSKALISSYFSESLKSILYYCDIMLQTEMEIFLVLD